LITFAIMVSFSFLTVLSLIPVVLTAPPVLIERGVTPSSSVGLAASFWSNWSEGSGSYRCSNGAGGSYTATWSGTNGGFVCGKGWNPGGPRTVKYSGTYTPTGPGYLAIYGWTQNPLIEYYVIESYGELDPGEPWTRKGNFTFEEGTYEIFTSTRVNKPSIEGTRTFQQYWSVRTEKRVGGTVTTSRHFDEWAKLGMRLGRHNYMIVATEGYTNNRVLASGSSSINVE
ncbi:glycoside hydrolase family 11 protein, partial [Patellaria atrata CBS 101060]